jgi:diguanylate cyclase
VPEITRKSQTHIELDAGELLFREGDSGADAYVVRSGRLEVFVTRADGERRLAERGPNEIIGEMALIDARPRSASVRAMQPCSLIVVGAEQMRRRLAEVDPITRLCLEVVLKRCRDMMSDGNVESGPAPEITGAALKALALESEIRRGVAEREFVLFYQPIVELESGALAGFEGLMRWLIPGRRPIPPAEFIPAAEGSGLICDLTEVVIEEARTFYPLLRAAGDLSFGTAPFLSINVSCEDLIHESFLASVGRLAETLGPAARGIKLEVTESGLMKDAERARMTLEGCRAFGVGVAIDDFGAGYSSLGYLATLPITTLKIDRSFTPSLPHSATSRKIVSTILRLADELRIPVVAEGVETPQEAEILTSLGCRWGQGYLFGRPADLAATLQLIKSWQVRPRSERQAPAARGAPLSRG